MMEWLKKAVINNKIYILRSMSYVNVINTLMMLYLTISNYLQSSQGIKLNMLYMIPISGAWICFLILFGIFEDKQGWYREEIDRTQSRSTHFNEMLHRLAKIENDVSAIKIKMETEAK